MAPQPRSKTEQFRHMMASRAHLLEFSLVASLALFGGQAGAAAEYGQGAQLAAMCASCHRLDGRDEGIPSIIGLDEKALTDAMEAFRSGARPSQIMHAVAGSLSTEEVAAVATYLAALQKGSEP
jgi:sulfide dehydrogenase cytochrome subunit